MRWGPIWAYKQSLLWFPCSAGFAARIGFTTQADAIDLPNPKCNPGRRLNRRWCSDWRPEARGRTHPPPAKLRYRLATPAHPGKHSSERLQPVCAASNIRGPRQYLFLYAKHWSARPLATALRASEDIHYSLQKGPLQSPARARQSSPSRCASLRLGRKIRPRFPRLRCALQQTKLSRGLEMVRLQALSRAEGKGLFREPIAHRIWLVHRFGRFE